VLDVLPIGGGFDLKSLLPLREPGPASRRRLIMVNGSQSSFDRGLVAIRALHLAAPALRDYEIAIYAVHEDVAKAAELLAFETKLAITLVPNLSFEDLMRLHGRSRVGLALNLGEGIGESAIESMVMGAFPIQSNAGCLNEWIKDGYTGLLVHPEDPDWVAAALQQAVRDDQLVDTAVATNDKSLELWFDAAILTMKIRRMYERIYADERLLR
jgi:glycosyltransferase involved in cell wall biosynthesis